MAAIIDEIKDAISLFDDPAWKHLPVRRRVKVAAAEIAEAACAVLRALDPDEADERLLELIDASEELFDFYIEPIDLPVGMFLEGFIDSALRRSIEPAIRRFAECLDN